MHHQVRDWDLAASTVRYSYYGGFRNAGLLFQELLDLAGIDVEAAGDDQVALAALQRVVAILRTYCHVAGAEITVGEAFFASPIAGGDVRTADVQLAVDQLDRHTWQREAYRPGAALSDVWIGGIHERLGHAVALQDHMSEKRLELFQNLRRQRGRTRHEQPH